MAEMNNSYIKPAKIASKKDIPASKRPKSDSDSPPDKSKLCLLEGNAMDIIMAKLDALQPFMEQTSIRWQAIEASFSKMDEGFKEAETRIETLESTVDEVFVLKQRVHELEKECENNSNRSRRNCLRIYGIPDGIEEGNLCDFFADFIKNLLKLDITLNLQDAHRLGPIPSKPDPKRPRGVIIHLLERRQVQVIIQAAKKAKDLAWKGSRIYINQDLSKASAIKKKAFLDMRPQFIKLNIQYGFIYPSTFKLTHNKVTKIYDNIEDIRVFLHNVSADEMETLPSNSSFKTKPSLHKK